jgi:hypothetical protein
MPRRAVYPESENGEWMRDDRTPEKVMDLILSQHLDGRLADDCFGSLEGIEHDDLPSIELALSKQVQDRGVLESIMAEYRGWLFQRGIEG